MQGYRVARAVTPLEENRGTPWGPHWRIKVNTPTVYCLGSHQYRLTKWQEWMAADRGFGIKEMRWHVEYNLYGCNGETVAPRRDAPNAWGWRTSMRTFPVTEEGYADAQRWVDHLLRPMDMEND